MSNGAILTPGGRTFYPPRVIEFARRMGESGYGVSEVQAALGKRGCRPHETTIARWIDSDYADARRMRRRRERQGRVQRGPRGWELRLARARELRSLGVSFTSITRILNHDHGLQLTSDQMRHALTGRFTDASVRALMRGEPIVRGRRKGARR